MSILADVATILISILVIGQGATWLVDASVRIARKLGVSELVIGLTIVAAGTSAPEFAVTFLAAVRDMGDISVGNIVGSNIFNLGFILGGTAIIRSLATNNKVVVRDGGFLLLGTLLLTGFLWDLSLGFLEGSVLLIMLSSAPPAASVIVSAPPMKLNTRLAALRLSMTGSSPV